MEEGVRKALQTVGGAVFYQMKRYKSNDITPHDWEYISYYLAPHTKTIFCIQEITENGFTVSVKSRTFKYVHHEFSDRRTVELVDHQKI